jgi:hypothetical protein
MDLRKRETEQVVANDTVAYRHEEALWITRYSEMKADINSKRKITMIQSYERRGPSN